MTRIERGYPATPPGSTNQFRYPVFHRFTRLLPGETATCATSAGMLPRDFPCQGREGGGR